MTHYQRLGVLRGAPAEVIRAAYKALAQTNHPDKNLDNPAATEAMQEINQAYAVLSDPQKRAEYDLWLGRQEAAIGAEWTQPPPRAPSSAPASPRHAGRRTGALILLAALAGAMAFSFSYSAFLHPVAPPALPAPSVPPSRAADKSMSGGASRAPGAPATERRLAGCVFAAASAYDVPPAVILGLLSAEDGAAGRETPAQEGDDLGPLQINSWWVPQLSRLWNVSADRARALLRDDSCINIGVGAWILHAAARPGDGLPQEIARYDQAAHHLAALPAENSAFVVRALGLVKIYGRVRGPEDLLDGKDGEKSEGRGGVR
ncbi:MAG: DnaJ domain-containing protein [Alphaproteobacteria bacterium]|nr:DnaJ domain-containing protein [Alphaproteobacteria bacterium]MDE2336929.1 DnaJ domain-containing protein [Alphaproteobacteria bacterium]